MRTNASIEHQGERDRQEHHCGEVADQHHRGHLVGFLVVALGEHGEYDIFSYGADGQPGGDATNADITNW